MKTSTLFLLIGTFLMVSCGEMGSENKSEMVPENSAEVIFKSDYPDAKEVEWSEEGDQYEVEFELKGVEYSIVYDSEGKTIEKEMEIPTESLPESVLSYIGENYPDAEMEEAEKVFKGEALFFEVELENEDDEEIELLFDADGNFLEEEVEDADEDGEHDHGEEGHQHEDGEHDHDENEGHDHDEDGEHEHDGDGEHDHDEDGEHDHDED